MGINPPSACKRVKVVPGVKVPVMVTNKRPSRAAVCETETSTIGGAFCGVTLHCVVALGVRARSPSILSVQFGASVPRTAVNVVKPVVLIVPLPVNVPERPTLTFGSR